MIDAAGQALAGWPDGRWHRRATRETLIAAVASRDSAAWAAMFTDDATYAIPEAPEPVRGREALDAMASMFFEAFPDMAFEVHVKTKPAPTQRYRWSEPVSLSG